MMDEPRAEPDSSDSGTAAPPAAPASPSLRRYFERPDADARPLTLRETLVVVLSTHLGVRTRQQRQEDFQRANGLHLFIAGTVYFALLIGLLIGLAVYFSGSR